MKSDERLLGGLKREEGYTYRGVNPNIPGRVTELEALGYELIHADGTVIESEDKADEIAAARESGGLLIMRISDEDQIKRGRTGQEEVEHEVNAQGIEARMAQDDRIKDRGDADMSVKERQINEAKERLRLAEAEVKLLEEQDSKAQAELDEAKVGDVTTARAKTSKDTNTPATPAQAKLGVTEQPAKGNLDPKASAEKELSKTPPKAEEVKNG